MSQVTEEKLLLEESIERREDEVATLKEEKECIQRSLMSSEQELQRLKELLEMTEKRSEEENRERYGPSSSAFSFRDSFIVFFFSC